MWHVKKKKKKKTSKQIEPSSYIQKTDWFLYETREGGWGGQKGTNFSYKISHGNTVDSKVTAVNSTMYIRVLSHV